MIIYSVSFIFSFIVVVTPLYDFIDNSSYDLFCSFFKRSIKENESLVLVDIDDNSMSKDFLPYSWPWPRFLHGDAVEVMADFGARAVIFDIEFMGKSSASVNYDQVNELKKNIQNNFQSIFEDFTQFTGSISKNKEMQRDLNPTWNAFNEKLTDYYFKIETNLNKATEDNDNYFGKRIRYAGNVFGTVSLDSKEKYFETTAEKEEFTKKMLEKFGYKKENLLKNKKSHPSILKETIAEFPEEKILSNFKGVGFTKIITDIDASTRSIPLFMEKDGFIFPQLSLKPFIDLFEIKENQIDLSNNNYVIFTNVKMENKLLDIKIPIFNNKMLINWPSAKFDEIFISNKNDVLNKKEAPQHFSYAYVLYYKYVALKQFEDKLNILLDFGENDLKNLFIEYGNFKEQKNALIEDAVLTYEIRKEIDSFYEVFLNKILQITDQSQIELRQKEIDLVIKQNKNNSQLVKQLEEIKINIENNLLVLRKSTENLISVRKILQNNLNNKICFVGLTATGTTDIGKNPFDKDFKNVGTHPSVMNTILQRDFIYLLSRWLILIFCVVFFSVIVYFLSSQKAIVIAFLGFFIVFVLILSNAIIFRLTNIYISPVIPFFYGMFSFVTMVVLEFIVSENDKRFIKGAFSRYLSPVVINELIKNPDKIELGGERRNCTAIFTDIESFSSFSEKFMEDPKGLVILLNEYLSAMSDIILNNGGTIDKYEGDAIIGFFGAPLDMKDHPIRACTSALQMKKIEDDLNKKFMEKNLIDKPLKTRIGLNTGDMFVGNMGTEKRLDYTMMGHSVNLAARLEGVNKQYETYILVSEYTHNEIKDDIICRKLDRVRVVNIKTPIRLYEPICVEDDLTPEILKFLEFFHDGLNAFERKDWKAAIDYFTQSKEIRGDKTSEIFIQRCNKFLVEPPPENWEGVYNLTVK